MPQPTVIYFVYKFRIKKSGLFYIGVTTDIDRRKVQHWCGIHICLHCRRATIPAYYKISADLIAKGEFTCNYKFVKSICVFKILDIKDTGEEAAKMESFLLKKYNNHPKFLNHAKRSSYKKTLI